MRGGNYCRIGKGIANYDRVEDGHPEVTTYKSINEAKKASRRMQLEKEGAIGRGSLYIAPKNRPAHKALRFSALIKSLT